MIRFTGTDGIGHKTKITDENGRDIGKMLGVKLGATITIGELVSAKADLVAVEMGIEADTVDYRLKHPVSGEFEPVSSIAFRDGAVVSFEEPGSVAVRDADGNEPLGTGELGKV